MLNCPIILVSVLAYCMIHLNCNRRLAARVARSRSTHRALRIAETVAGTTSRRARRRDVAMACDLRDARASRAQAHRGVLGGAKFYEKKSAMT